MPSITNKKPHVHQREMKLKRKAARLAKMVQGTMGLEAQGLSPSGLHAVEQIIYQQLLTTR